MVENKYASKRWLGCTAMLVLLSGCMSSTKTTHVQVIDRNAESAPRQPVYGGQYVVQPGDTLYGIAFRYGWDWKRLAAHNNIQAPYTIRPGQRLRFGAVAANPVASVKPANPPARVVTKTAPKAVTAPASTPKPVPSVVKNTVTNTPAVPAKSASGWAWPASGTLIGRYASNGSLNKGIDISGQLGQPVLAASNGTVVYAGSGLRGYGELVIIKHSDIYVSAYGHNRRLLVREGQQVKAGQAIAEMGSSGTDRVKLHFEIRRQGKPVDPLQYLPRR